MDQSKVLYISGSPRKESNTDYLLRKSQKITGGEFLKLIDYEVKPCDSCWICRNGNKCKIEDDMTEIILPKLKKSKGFVIGSPVYFNNVSSQTKAFMDRTWAIRGELENKIGGAIVVGRKYGHENAITAINSFFLKHEMIIANRGVSGIAFKKGSVTSDKEAIEASVRLGERINQLKIKLD